MPVADRIIGYADIAAITGRSHRTIRRWFQDGYLRRVRFARMVGCWESELISVLGWRGVGSLVVDDPNGAYRDADDPLDDLHADLD